MHLSLSLNMQARSGEKPRTMTAWQLTAPGRIEPQSCECPEPGPHEVRIRMEGCGLCASGIPVWEGRSWFSYPQEKGHPGHEGYGTVDKTGAEVSRLAIGDRVTGLMSHAFAEYDLANETELIKVPAELHHMPLPGEPLGCAMNIFKRSRIAGNQKVAIIGGGFLGSILTQLAHQAGAEVFAISQRPYSLNMASRMGADHTIPFNDQEATAGRIDELTRKEGCDCVLEATGVQAALDLATKLVAFGGRIVVAGFHQGGLRQVNMQEWNWKGIDVINAHERDPRKYMTGITEALRALKNGTLDVGPLFTHFYPPDRLPEAFETLVKRPEGFVKGIIVFP